MQNNKSKVEMLVEQEDLLMEKMLSNIVHLYANVREHELNKKEKIDVDNVMKWLMDWNNCLSVFRSKEYMKNSGRQVQVMLHDILFDNLFEQFDKLSGKADKTKYLSLKKYFDKSVKRFYDTLYIWYNIYDNWKYYDE